MSKPTPDVLISRLARKAGWTAAFAAILFLTGCNITKRGEKGKEQVDIETPVGSIHVNKPTSAAETGLPAYPGAKPAEDTDQKSANVNIDTAKFGFKTIVVKFQTDDSPQKVLDFYRQHMKSMGPISECQGSFHLEVRDKGQRQDVQCEQKPNQTELMVGDSTRHRAVSVKADGKGSRFELVFVQSRGERETL